MTIEQVRLVDIVGKFVHPTFSNDSLNNIFRYFAEVLPLHQSEWVIVGTGESDTELEMMIFFKTDRAVRQFEELAKAVLGGVFISGMRIKKSNADNRDLLIQELFKIGYLKYAQENFLKSGQIAVKRFSRLIQVTTQTRMLNEEYNLIGRNELEKFRHALNQKEFLDAEDLLAKIGNSGRLSSVNMCFLEYQLWHVRGEFKKIWLDQRIVEVLRSRRPRVVTEFLLVSLWRQTLVELKSGDLAKIPTELISWMKELLKSVVCPSTPEGRLCLAVVTALSGVDVHPEWSSVGIPDEERKVLEGIIDTKSIPSALLESNQQLLLTNDLSDLKIEVDNLVALAEGFRDDGDARNLLKVLDFAEANMKFVEDVIKRLVRCVADELFPDFAVITLERLKNTGLDTSTWSRSLSSALQKVTGMSQVYLGGWVGLLEMNNLKLAENQKVIVESAASWPVFDFLNQTFDQSFSKWLEHSDPTIITDELLSTLLTRLSEEAVGENTVSMIESIREFGRGKEFQVNALSGETTLQEIIRVGESDKVEFKSSLRSPMQGEDVTKELRNSLEFACVKSCAAMLHNEEGGTLLIGVNDDGKVVGLDLDYQSSSNIGDRDGFERHFRQLLSGKISELGPSEVKISFESVAGLDVAIVSCRPAIAPRPVKDGAKEFFFVRNGNATIDLAPTMKKLLDFSKVRFGK